MTQTVLIDMPVCTRTLAELEASGHYTFRIADPITEKAIERPVDLIDDVDVLFCSLPPANHEAMRALRFIQVGSAGFTQLVGKGFPERGIRTANALGVVDTAIAEWNLAMMVNLARNLRQLIRHQEAGVWDRSGQFQREVRGSTVGIWGYGGIGRETARLAKNCGLTVHVLTRHGVKPRTSDHTYSQPGTGDPDGTLPDRVFTLDERFEFLRGLDFLILAMPMNKHNEGIVGPQELAALPERAFLLNPARGPLIQERALIDALREHRIAGAALDAHFAYPLPPDHPLWRMEHVILTPHISGSSQGPHYLTRIWDLFSRNLARLNRGEPLLNELAAESLCA